MAASGLIQDLSQFGTNQTVTGQVVFQRLGHYTNHTTGRREAIFTFILSDRAKDRIVGVAFGSHAEYFCQAFGQLAGTVITLETFDVRIQRWSHFRPLYNDYDIVLDRQFTQFRAAAHEAWSIDPPQDDTYIQFSDLRYTDRGKLVNICCVVDYSGD
jgi:hypothetical protein